MTWKQRKSSRDCARQPLAELIRDELDEEGCERLATHLDDCETCQQRLTVLAAESQWWLDASRWLDPAAGGIDSCHEELAYDDFTDNDSHYGNPEKDLLASGLLDASEKAGVLGTLGRYEVQSVIGAGGTGIVLKAIDVELNRTVAIKVLSPALAASGAARRRFAREGQAVAAVAHENVVAVYQVEGEGRLPYLVMQYIDGDSLQDLVVHAGPLDVTTALRMTAQIAAALSTAHDQGLVHRDVKPANILVGAAGQRIWITDFGLARAVDDASLTRTGFIAGTPHYMSPEQARGEVVRASSDLFGLGSVLYFMLTGRPPFRAERTLAILSRICNEPHRPVREVNPDVPPQIADLVDRLLSKSVAARVSDAHTVRTHCLHLLAALTDPDGDLNTVEVGVSFLASVNARAKSPDHRHHVRYGAWTVGILLLIGLNVTLGAYVSRARQAVVDQSNSTAEVADIEAEAFAMASVDESDASSDSVVAAVETGSSATVGEESFAIVDYTVDSAEMKSPWQPYSTPQLPVKQRPAEELSDKPPVAIDSNSTSPAWGAGQLMPEPAQPDTQRSTVGDVVVANEEPSVWAFNLHEFRASFASFEAQIEQPPRGMLRDSYSISPLVSDSFSEELRRMEDRLRTLEAKPISVY